MKIIYWLLNPNRFLKYSCFWLNLFSFFYLFSCFFVFYNLYDLNYIDHKQSFYAQIIFIHVPAAWMCIFSYIILSVSSLLFLINKHPILAYINDILCISSLFFVLITLLTGSLWGKPTWGTWWVWDARLTSVFILFLILTGIIIVKNSFNDIIRGSMVLSFLALIGLLNIPIIKFSVEWWNTLHQPASISLFNSHIDYSIIYSLFGILFIFFTFFVIIIIIYIRIVVLMLKLNK